LTFWKIQKSKKGCLPIGTTFTNDFEFVNTSKEIMLRSREISVNYMTPLGLHHIMARSHHWGPGPWLTGGGGEDWNATY